MQLRTQALSGIKWTTVSSAVTTVTSIIQLAVLCRLLLPDDFGLMAITMVVIGFGLAFADMGISNAIIHYQSEDKEQLSTLYWLNIIAGVILFLLLLAFKKLIASFYHEPRLDPLLFIASFIFLITPIAQQYQILLERELKFALIAAADVVSAVAGLGAAVALAYAGFGVLSLILAQLSSTVVRTLVISVVGFRRWRPLFFFSLNGVQGYLRFGLYQIGERSINYLGGNLDKLLIGTLLGAQPLGYYTVAYQLMTRPFATFNPIVTRVAFPLFAKIQNENERLRSGYLDAIRIIAFVLFPLYAGMIVLARPFIAVLIGANWLPAVPVFQILCLLGYFYSLGNPLGSLLLAKGRPDLAFFANVLMIALYATAVWIGSGSGLIGIAGGIVLATMFVLFPIGFWIRWALVGMRPGEYLQAFMPMLVSSLLMGGVVHSFVTQLISQHNDMVQLSLSLVVGTFTYVPVIYVWQKQAFIRIIRTSLSPKRTICAE